MLTLQFCVNYGGRAEIVDATRRSGASWLQRDDLIRASSPRSASGISSTNLTFPTSICSSARLGSSARPTSCSGRARTRSWFSLIDCGPTSIAVIFGGRSSSTPQRDRRYGGAAPNVGDQPIGLAA